MLNWVNCILSISLFLLTNLLFGACSGKTCSKKVTCRKVLVKCNTPYKPKWGPSLCGNSASKAKAKKTQAKKHRTRNYTNKLQRNNDDDIFPIQRDRLSDNGFIKKLQEIHSLQTALLEGKYLLTQEEKLMKRNKIKSIYRQISSTIRQTNDFPFPNQMWDMESVLSGIKNSKITSEFTSEGKTDRQLLREIQSAQLNLCRKTIDQQYDSRDMGPENF